MQGMIIGWRRDYDGVQFFGGRDLLVGVGTYKELRHVDSGIAFGLLGVVEVRPRVVELVLKQIGQCNNTSAFGIDEVRRVLGAASAATKQTDADGGVGSRAVYERRLDKHGARSGRGNPDK